MRRTALAVGLASALLLAGAACTGDDDDAAGGDTTTTGDATTTAPPTTAATTTTLSAEEEVVAAYRAAIEAFAVASNPPNPDHPLLVERMTGQQLDFARSALTQLRALNTAHILTPELHPGDAVITGDNAALTDCLVDHTRAVDLATGAPIGEPGETVLHVDVGMQRISGVWKLAAQTRRTDSCDPSDS
ncbi:MAG: hypothetical protein ACRD0A_09220 [Acidimicrobiales bacterium]